ncbi:MAG: energy transducer TonB [Deltaproteobacteria bacterium]|nr:energy transducer TonB [Deltaproteobacteria bacterium]
MDQRSLRLRHAPGFGNARRISLAVSLLFHGLLFLVLARSTIRLIAPSQLIHVTLVEAAPPPPPAAGGGAAAPLVDDGRPVIVPEPVSIPRALPLRKAKPVPATPIRRQVTRVNEPKNTAATETTSVPGGVEPNGATGGVAGGDPGGKVGGTVGGRGDQILPVDQVAVAPTLISGPKPDYPPLARLRGVEGLVVIEATIDRNGSVEGERLRVVESIPPLDPAALRAVRSWRFRPGRDRDGEAVRVALRVPIRFQLR